MTTTPLPPLPDPMWPQSGRDRPYEDAYSAANMQAYATAARADLEAENKRLREALQTIADNTDDPTAEAVARTALKGTP